MEIISRIYDLMRRTEKAANEAGFRFLAEINSHDAFKVYIFNKDYSVLTSEFVNDISEGDNYHRVFAALGYMAGYIKAAADAKKAADAAELAKREEVDFVTGEPINEQEAA